LKSTWRTAPSAADRKKEPISTKVASAMLNSRVSRPASRSRGSRGSRGSEMQARATRKKTGLGIAPEAR